MVEANFPYFKITNNRKTFIIRQDVAPFDGNYILVHDVFLL